MTEPKNEVMVRELRSQKLPDVGNATTANDKPIALEVLRAQRGLPVKTLMGTTEYERRQRTASEGEQNRAPSVPVNSTRSAATPRHRGNYEWPENRASYPGGQLVTISIFGSNRTNASCAISSASCGW
jgi:hypothetical protein